MCGFGYVFSCEISRDKFKNAARRYVAPRGPDAFRTEIQKQHHFAHARLSLQGGDYGIQPAKDVLGRFFLLYNGEIYNTREIALRYFPSHKDLNVLTESDTRLVLELLVHKRFEAFNEIHGIYAFCMIDTQSNKVLFMRDHFGVKPCYFHISSSGIGLSSSSRFVANIFDLRKSEKSRLAFALALSIPQPASVFDGCYSARPGVLMQCDLTTLETRQSFKISQNNALDNASNMLSSEGRENTKMAVGRVIEAEYSVGSSIAVPLSGGLDSGIILDSLQNQGSLTCINITKSDSDKDFIIAEKRARRIGASFISLHRNSRSGPTQDQFLSAIDSPSLDGWNVFNLSFLARQEGLKVLMGGIGPDEFLKGYARTSVGIKNLVATNVCLQFVFGSRLLKRGVEDALRYCFVRGQRNLLAVQRAFDASASEIDFALDMIQESVSRSMDVTGIGPTDAYYLLNQLLIDGDQFTAWNGVEMRVPFLSRRITSIFYEARNHYDRQDKWFLRKLYPSVSGDSMSLKQGFSLNLKEVDSVSQSVSDRVQLVWDSIHV